MGSLGREIAGVIAEMRELSETDLMPDTYSITRMVRVPDGYGGYIEEPQIVESGACRLSKSAGGAERLFGDVLTAIGPYVVHLPLTTSITASDTIAINGREFSVAGEPKRSGEWAIGVTAAVEVRS